MFRSFIKCDTSLPIIILQKYTLNYTKHEEGHTNYFGVSFQTIERKTINKESK